MCIQNIIILSQQLYCKRDSARVCLSKRSLQIGNVVKKHRSVGISERLNIGEIILHRIDKTPGLKIEICKVIIGLTVIMYGTEILAEIKIINYEAADIEIGDNGVGNELSKLFG